MACFKGTTLSSSPLPQHPLLLFSIFSSYLFSHIILLFFPLHFVSTLPLLSSSLTFLDYHPLTIFFLYSCSISFLLSPPPCLYVLYTLCPPSLYLLSFLYCLLSSLLPFFSNYLTRGKLLYDTFELHVNILFYLYFLFSFYAIIFSLIIITHLLNFSTFIVHYEMDRLFCSKCGANHMSRVGASVNAKTGELKLHLKANYVVNTLGK